MFWTKEPTPSRIGIPREVRISQCRTVPKVYRENYEINTESLMMQADRDEIPDFFRNPCLEDITPKYLVCRDITLDFDIENAPRYAFLCCYNQDMTTLEPVAWAPIRRNKATFKDVGINVLYFVAIFQKNEMKFVNNPFILTADGRHELKADTDQKETVTLFNKVPFRRNALEFSDAMQGGRFQVFNRSDGTDSTTLFAVAEAPFYYQSVEINNAPSARFAARRCRRNQVLRKRLIGSGTPADWQCCRQLRRLWQRARKSL
jgi:hypothetical protein